MHLLTFGEFNLTVIFVFVLFKASGINLKAECIDAFNEMKLRKNCSYITFRIDKDLKNIEIAERGDLGETFEDFRTKMVEAGKAGQGRYAVYNLTEGQDESSKRKTGNLVFITWICDVGPTIKQKMLYASSKSVFKKSFDDIQADLQINDADELTLENIKSKLADKAKK